MSLVGAGDLLKNFGPSSCFVLFSRSPTVISPSKSHPGAGIPSFHEQLRVRIYLRLFSSSSFPCTLPQTPGDRKYFWMLSDISPGLSRPTTGEMTQTQHWWPLSVPLIPEDGAWPWQLREDKAPVPGSSCSRQGQFHRNRCQP